MQKQGKLWITLLVLAFASTAALYALRGSASEKTANTVTIKTAEAHSGPLERTLRLSGTTAAERYNLMIAPRLRGMRSRGGSSSAGSSSSSSSSSASSSTTEATTPAAGSAASLGTGAASAGTAVNASSAFRSATSRFGSSSSKSSSSSTSSTSSSKSGAGSGTSSNSAGSSGLGSTGGSLMSIGGGGGNDFNLVLKELVPAGSLVKEGQVIAEFDRQNMLNRLDDFKASVQQSEASLKSQKADVEASRKAHAQSIASAKAAVEKAELDMKTLPVLSEIDSVRTRLALEQAQAKYKQLVNETKFVEAAADARIKQSELNLKESQLELERAQRNVDRMLVRAPFDGLAVLETIWRGGDFGQIRVGDRVWPGRGFVRVVDTNSMVIDAQVNQVDINRLHIGQKATVRFDAYPGLVLKAHLENVPVVNKSGGFRANFVKEMPVRLKLDETDPRVIPDLSASVDIVLDSVANTVLIPRGALFSEKSKSGNGNAGTVYFVYVRRNGTWQRQDVEPGLMSNISASVRRGLQPGDIVALETPPKPGEKKPQG